LGRPLLPVPLEPLWVLLLAWRLPGPLLARPLPVLLVPSWAPLPVAHLGHMPPAPPRPTPSGRKQSKTCGD
jgi:hypothetical protein